MVFLRYEIVAMTTNLDIINAAVLLIIKAALLAARFSGRVRKRSLKRLAAMDVNEKGFSSGKVGENDVK